MFVTVGKGKKIHVLYGSIIENGYTMCKMGSPELTDKKEPICKICTKVCKEKGYEVK